MKKILFLMLLMSSMAIASVYMQLGQANYSEYYVKISNTYYEIKYSTSCRWQLEEVNSNKVKGGNYEYFQDLIFYLNKNNTVLVPKKSMNKFKIEDN
ncbi:MAG: hypothetical protein ACRCX2_33200 [Paraclostridium sp.]